MTIPIPSAGGPVLDTWGAAVATKLNAMIPLIVTADQATNSATAQDITELQIPVVAGRAYNIQLHGSYSVSATNQGLQLGYSGPGGAGALDVRIWGNASPTGETVARSFDGSLTGRTSTDTTGTREFWAYLRYACTTTGTLKIQFARGGTSGSTGVTLQAGCGGWVIEGTP